MAEEKKIPFASLLEFYISILITIPIFMILFISFSFVQTGFNTVFITRILVFVIVPALNLIFLFFLRYYQKSVITLTSDESKRRDYSSILKKIIYAIFIVFLVVVFSLKFMLLPTFSFTELINAAEFQNLFLYLNLIQGLFTGLIMGQLLENNPVKGLKHSIVMMLIGSIIYFI